MGRFLNSIVPFEGYKDIAQRIQDGINADLIEAYPKQRLDMTAAVWDNQQTVFEDTKTRFIFVMDEWDAIFHKSFITQDNKKVIWNFCGIC